MKAFYVAKNYSGETKSGELEVKNERELAAQLRADGFILTSFKEIKDDSKKINIKFLDRFFSISLKDKLMFSRNLGVMISSGLPLTRAIKNLSVQTKNKRFQEILDNIFADIQSGSTFADSLAKFPGVFNELFVNMTRVGEMSGNLEEVLGILADQLEKEHDLTSKVKGALTYPLVIIVAMIGIGVVMLTYVLPKMMTVFKDMDVELPAPTRFIMGLSDTFQAHSILIISGLVFSGIFLKFFLKTAPGKKTLGFLAINLPIISAVAVKVNCARFARIYSSLLRSGVSVVEALKIISHTLTNYYYKDALSKGVEQIQKGINLSEIIKGNPKIFPVLVAQMVEVGEETGKTENVLLKLAEFYEGEIAQFTKNISSVIEPILMIFIGAAVGFFAIAMLQPMYSLMDNIK